MAKVAQECEQNEDCVSYMREVIQQGCPLSYNERNLISAAYKGIVSPLRDTLRLLQDDCHHYDTSAAAREVSELLAARCDEVVGLVRATLLPSATEPEVKVFYMKMAADYLRYKWEGAPPAGRDEVCAQCRQAYQDAAKLADTSLPAYHPLRLGLCLNFAVFIYEVLGDARAAYQLALKAYSESSSGINQLSPDSKEEAMHTIELLLENIKLWKQ